MSFLLFDYAVCVPRSAMRRASRSLDTGMKCIACELFEEIMEVIHSISKRTR